MNLLGKITKTQLLLLFMTASFLISLTFLYPQASEVAVGTDYTITTAHRATVRVTPEAPALIDLNTATLEELQTLNGIGAAMAQRIIDYRTEYGPFTCVDELLHVKGIGEATLAGFRDHVTVSPQNEPEQETANQSIPEIEAKPDDEASGGENISEPAAEPPETLPPENNGSTVPPEDDSDVTVPEEPEMPSLIDLNTATLEELQTLNGIGEVLAQRIIDYRRSHGPFTCVDDLLYVKGIGESTLRKFRDCVTVSGQGDAKRQEETRADEGTEEDPNGDEPEASGLIDLNTATLEELQTLNGIGEVLAQRIIDYRRSHGPFTCVDDLLSVKGIGEATLKKLLPYVTVSGQNDPEPSDETTTAEEDPK